MPRRSLLPSFSVIAAVIVCRSHDPTRTNAHPCLWGLGPTLLFDTAEEKVLGTGANSAGVGALAVYIGKKWRFGALPMQFWSYDEDDVAHAESSARFFVVPALPALGSNLAKTLKK